MPRSECGTVCPTSAARCDKTAPNHRLCSGWSNEAGGHIDWPNPAYEPPKTTETATAKSTLREMADRLNGSVTGVEGSERAARRWTTAQRLLVEAAITQVAEERDEFTTDHVWAVLGDRVPMTSGMAAMLRKAATAGHITQTDRHADSRRERTDHDAGRRLSIWRSRMR